MGNEQSTFDQWCRLLRVPNLLTAPGDPLAGFLLCAGLGAAATGGIVPPQAGYRMAAAGTASLFLYAAGLVENDLADANEDRRERPDRPLASGAIQPWPALAAFFLLLAGGLGLAALAGKAAGWLAAILVLVMTSYNLRLKRWAVIGPLAMGACRGLSVMLGAAAAAGANALTFLPALLAAGGITLYIAAVTQIARNETRQVRLGLIRLAPAGVFIMLAAAMLAVLLVVLESSAVLPARMHVYRDLGVIVAYVTLSVQVLVGVLATGAQLRAAPPAQVQRGIGVFIRQLPLMQALVCLATPALFTGLAAAAALVLAAFASGRLARRFYSS